jgi:hypothetical protein
MATLMQREWLQHRMAWGLLMGIPLGLGLLLVGFAQRRDRPSAGRDGRAPAGR